MKITIEDNQVKLLKDFIDKVDYFCNNLKIHPSEIKELLNEVFLAKTILSKISTRAE